MFVMYVQVYRHCTDRYKVLLQWVYKQLYPHKYPVCIGQYEPVWCVQYMVLMIEILTSYSTVNLWGFEFNTLRCLDVVRNVSIHHDYWSSHPTSRKKAISSGSNHGTPHPKSTQWLQEIRMGGSIVLKIMTYYLLTLNRKSATLKINITVRSLIICTQPLSATHTWNLPTPPWTLSMIPVIINVSLNSN